MTNIIVIINYYNFAQIEFVGTTNLLCKVEVLGIVIDQP